MSLRANGIVIGIVSSLEDPDSLGRVQVKYPYLGDQESDWARLVSLMAGPDRGAFFRPEVGDEVLVALEHGDYRRPYILGALWSQADTPPADDGDVEVSAGSGSVKVEATTVEVKASGDMTLEATGTMTIKGATVNIN